MLIFSRFSTLSSFTPYYNGIFWPSFAYVKKSTVNITSVLHRLRWTVRRDNCPLVQNVIAKCLEKLLIDKDVEGAKSFVKEMVENILKNKIDNYNYIFHKPINKWVYKRPQPHVELAKYINKEGGSIKLGDMIPFLIKSDPASLSVKAAFPSVIAASLSLIAAFPSLIAAFSSLKYAPATPDVIIDKDYYIGLLCQATDNLFNLYK